MAEVEAEEGAAVELGGLSPSVTDELLMLYFENRRRSGGGPVLSWQRLGHGGVLTFQEPAGEGLMEGGSRGPHGTLALTTHPPPPTDAARVLAQEHTLQGARLSLRTAPPRAPARLLLQGLPPGTTPQRLEQHVQTLLCATGHPEQPCRALASPRPDRALVQLPKPLSEAGERRDWGSVPYRGDALSQLAPFPQKSVRWRSRPGPWAWRGPKCPWRGCHRPELCVWWVARWQPTCCCWSCTWRTGAAVGAAPWTVCAACPGLRALSSASGSGKVSGAAPRRPSRPSEQP